MPGKDQGPGKREQPCCQPTKWFCTSHAQWIDADHMVKNITIAIHANLRDWLTLFMGYIVHGYIVIDASANLLVAAKAVCLKALSS